MLLIIIERAVNLSLQIGLSKKLIIKTFIKICLMYNEQHDPKMYVMLQELHGSSNGCTSKHTINIYKKDVTCVSRAYLGTLLWAMSVVRKFLWIFASNFAPMNHDVHC